MRANMRVLVVMVAFIAGSLVSESGFSGPVNNAQQFQQKAISSALKDPKSKNYGSKKEYIEWVSDPVSAPSDASGKEPGKATGDTKKVEGAY